MIVPVIADRHICCIFDDEYNITFGVIKQVYALGKKYNWNIQTEILGSENLNFNLPEQFRGRFVIAIGKCIYDGDTEKFYSETEEDAQTILREVQELFGVSSLVTYVETKYNG